MGMGKAKIAKLAEAHVKRAEKRYENIPDPYIWNTVGDSLGVGMTYRNRCDVLMAYERLLDEMHNGNRRVYRTRLPRDSSKTYKTKYPLNKPYYPPNKTHETLSSQRENLILKIAWHIADEEVGEDSASFDSRHDTQYSILSRKNDSELQTLYRQHFPEKAGASVA